MVAWSTDVSRTSTRRANVPRTATTNVNQLAIRRLAWTPRAAGAGPFPSSCPRPTPTRRATSRCETGSRSARLPSPRRTRREGPCAASTTAGISQYHDAGPITGKALPRGRKSSGKSTPCSRTLRTPADKPAGHRRAAPDEPGPTDGRPQGLGRTAPTALDSGGRAPTREEVGPRPFESGHIPSPRRTPRFSCG